MNSLLFEVLEIKAAAEATGGYLVTVHLGAFGSSSSKPLWLLGNAPWLRSLSAASHRRMQLQPKTGHQPLAITEASGGVTGAAGMSQSEDSSNHMQQ